MKSGWFFIDIIATFPFYLIERTINVDSNHNTSLGILFKLLRCVRLPKILKLLDFKFLEGIVFSLMIG